MKISLTFVVTFHRVTLRLLFARVEDVELEFDSWRHASQVGPEHPWENGNIWFDSTKAVVDATGIEPVTPSV